MGTNNYNAPLSDGITATDDSGTQLKFAVSGSWQAEDSWSIVISDTSGSINVGMGTIFKARPVAALTLANRVYFVAGSTLFYSSIGDPTAWDPQDVGSGYIVVTSRSAATENLIGLASYQGRLALFSPRTVQIWSIDADPTKFALNQVLENIGTLAGESVKSVGDLDVYFVAKTGVRSLRVRDSSLNAYVTDIGSAVDKLVQAKLRQQKTSGKPICAVIEPTDNRYWLFVEDTIFVLSSFPSSKVVAWSTYTVGFEPVKIVVSDLRVYVRGSDDKVYLFGGQDGEMWDNVQLTVETPWLDAKTPGTNKMSEGVDLSASSLWQMSGTMDYLSRIAPMFIPIVADRKPTFDRMGIPFSARGTHVKFRMTTTEAAEAVLSMILWHYKEEEEK